MYEYIEGKLSELHVMRDESVEVAAIVSDAVVAASLQDGVGSPVVAAVPELARSFYDGCLQKLLHVPAEAGKKRRRAAAAVSPIT